MDSTNIVTPTVTAVPIEKRMQGEDFFGSDSESVRPSIPPFPSQFCPNFQTWFFSMLDIKRDASVGGKTGHNIVCVGNCFTFAKNCVAFYNGWYYEKLLFWICPNCGPLFLRIWVPYLIWAMCWKLTPIVWSHSLVITHLKTIENRRYVHLWYKKSSMLCKEWIYWCFHLPHRWTTPLPKVIAETWNMV